MDEQIAREIVKEIAPEGLHIEISYHSLGEDFFKINDQFGYLGFLFEDRIVLFNYTSYALFYLSDPDFFVKSRNFLKNT